MKRGEPFNPYTLHAVRVPLGMLTYPGISAGAKLLYGRLALYLGKPRAGAHCDPALPTLARDMATSVDTISRWLAELIVEKFIERRHRGRLCAECILLPHACLSNSAELRNQDAAPVPQPCGVEDAAPVPQPCGVEDAPSSAELPLQFRNSAVSVPQPCGVVYKEENVHENVHENVQASSRIMRVSAAPEIGEAAERMYALHPKKKNLVLVLPSLERAVSSGAHVSDIEVCHAEWCATDDWRKANGRFAPKLDEWISDKGYTQHPNPNGGGSDSASTVERAMALMEERIA